MRCNKILENLEILNALETLEYHDRNYLSFAMAQPSGCNVEKRRLLCEAISDIEKLKVDLEDND